MESFRQLEELTLSIVIPAYNEEGNIEGVVEDSLNVLSTLTSRFEIIVIDDCSTDQTPVLLEKLSGRIPQLKVVRNAKNIGCHPSSMVGYRLAQGDFRLFIPADRQIPPSEISKFLEPALKGADVVYSWRKHRADPMHRLLISGFYNGCLRVMFGLRLHDIDSAELLSKRAVELILPTLHSESAVLTVEMVLEAKRQGLKIVEVEINHLPRTSGQAKGISFAEQCRVPFNFLKIFTWFLMKKWAS